MLRLFKFKLANVYFQIRLIFKSVAIVDNSNFDARSNSDVAELLPFLFILARFNNPQCILELGTRGGESTKVLLKVCELAGVKGRSVDLSPAPDWLCNNSSWDHFVSDDIEFARNLARRKLWPNGEIFYGIDFLFIDTSHEYLHTKEELAQYWPLINSGGLLVFHDTNLRNRPTWKLSRKLNWGWNNQRGVTRAIEEFFTLNINEELLQVKTDVNAFEFLFNIPWNNGLCAIKKN